MAADYTPITGLTNLTGAQRAYQLPGGEKAVVEIQTKEIAASAFNATASQHLAVLVTVWQINDDGTPVLDAKDKKISPPAKSETILTAGLAEGTVTLENVLTQMTLDALKRMQNWLAIHPHITALLAVSK